MISIARAASIGIGLLALVGAGAQHAAQAQDVALAGMMGGKALLVVDGGSPKAVSPGEAHRGVKVIATQGDHALLEIGGKRLSMRVGDAPVSVGQPIATATGSRIVLASDAGGHFIGQGLVNARPVQFLIDTGATTIGISVSDAERIGLQYKTGEPVRMATANGAARGWKIRLSSVRINDVEIHDIEAVVVPLEMPFVLLGNNYLSRFQMTRNNDQMVLEKRF